MVLLVLLLLILLVLLLVLLLRGLPRFCGVFCWQKRLKVLLLLLQYIDPSLLCFLSLPSFPFLLLFLLCCCSPCCVAVLLLLQAPVECKFTLQGFRTRTNTLGV